MENVNIDALSGHELDRVIARELGIRSPLFPCCSTDIAAAWELDGEGWEWRLTEIPFEDENIIAIGAWVKLPNAPHWIASVVNLNNFSTKSTAQATARCRVWLKAKYAEKNNANM